jgi:hypothetical protein
VAAFGIGERKLLGGTLIALGMIPFYFAFRAFQLRRRMEDTPTSKVRSMAIGLVELKGKVVAGETVLSPYTKKPCVFYDYRMERLEVRRFYSPSARRWITTREWVLERTASECRRFYLEDETGRVLVDPEGADVPEVSVYEEGNAPRRKHSERVVLPGSAVYVMGTAAERDDSADGTEGRAGRLLIRKGPLESDFIITAESEKQVESQFALRFLAGLVLGLLVMGLGAWMVAFS